MTDTNETAEEKQTRETAEKKREKRRTDAEMMAHYLAEAERCKARMEGRSDTSSEGGLQKALETAIKKRNTLKHQAEICVNGKAPTAKSPAQSTIDVKVANAEKRLADLKETRSRALERIARFPEDIERLQLTLDALKDGDDVEFPTGLLGIESDPTVGEMENAQAIAQDDEK